MTAQSAPRNLGSAYVLESRIGTGAQGEVWSGRHVDTNEILAFKVLRAELVDSPGVVDRFIKERSTLLRVRSPFVVAIRDVVIEGSTFAIVMDYVGGGDLGGLLRAEGPVPPGRLAALGSGIAQGLAAVHRAGVVHRDIKPANILLDRPGPQPPAAPTAAAPGGAYDAVRPRVADFGVARICDTFATGHVTEAIGTPLYMAPEILSAQPPTPAADVYSLGVVLYQMICGTTPFVGQSAQLLAQHARRDPGRPVGVPDPLWELVSSMLGKQPGSRPGIEAVAHRLEQLHSGLAGLPAAPLLDEPPQTTVSSVPYDWDADASPADLPPAADGVTTAAAPEAATAVAYTAPTLALGRAAARHVTPSGYYDLPPAPAAHHPGAAVGTVPDHGAAASPQAPTQRGSGGGGWQARKARRRWRALAAAVLVMAVVGAAAAGVLWWRDRGTAESYRGWLASLPQGDTVQEDLRVLDVSEAVTSPGGSLYAAKSDGKWSLYDIAGTRTAPVWTGKCDKAVFWNDSLLRCKTSSGSTLVGRDGSTSAAPLSTFTWVGASSEYAVIVDGSYSGDLVAYDTDGAEAWRVRGDYSEGVVSNGYIVTHDSGLNEIQVLSASTGTVLVSVQGDEPDFPDESSDFPDLDTDSTDSSARHPGGFNILTGTKAFSRVTEEGVTIYEADGTEAQTVKGDFPLENDFVTSVPMDAKTLAEAYSTSAEDVSASYAFGPDGGVKVVVDTDSCTATADGRRLEVPVRESGEGCLIRPLGALGGGTVLMQVGELIHSSTAAGSVIAFSLSDGKPTWQAGGTLVRVVPVSREGAGGRLLMAYTGSSRVDAVVVSVKRS